MKPMKIIAGLALTGGLAAGAMGVSAGVASADPGPGMNPVLIRWGALRRVRHPDPVGVKDRSAGVLPPPYSNGGTAAARYQAAGTAAGSGNLLATDGDPHSNIAQFARDAVSPFVGIG